MTIYGRLKASTAPLMDKFKNPKGQAVYRRKVKTPDGGGGYDYTWSTIGSFDAIILPASAVEKQEADRRNTQVSHKVMALYDDASGVTSKDQIVFDGRQFNVEYPLNIAEGDMWLSMMCMEGVAQ